MNSLLFSASDYVITKRAGVATVIRYSLYFLERDKRIALNSFGKENLSRRVAILARAPRNRGSCAFFRARRITQFFDRARARWL